METFTDNVKLRCPAIDDDTSHSTSLTIDTAKYDESTTTYTHDTSSSTHEKTSNSKMINMAEEQTDEFIAAVHDSTNCHFGNVNEDVNHPNTIKSVEELLNTSTTRITDSIDAVHTPQYNLSALWDKHCEYEFDTRDVAATMSTMIPEPYVNHIPTMTGGVGAKELARFYEHHFINGNPADTCMIPISRTIGADRVVDEMLICFTHDREIDWMLPGVAPTGKPVKIPLVAIVSFQGDKLSNEHIYWDQASVLAQIGLLDTTNLPVAGVETANKLLNKSLPSNTLMKRWAESANKN